MRHTTSPLIRYRDEDRELLDIDALSKRALISRAFICLAMTLGCPSYFGLMSPEMLLEWLFGNYGALRAAAGLPPLPSIEGVSRSAHLRLKMGNAVLTLLQFSESRSVSMETKEQLRAVQQTVDRALDRS